MAVTTDVTHLIERLEAFEDRLGVRLESLSAEFKRYDDTGFVTVLGELHPRSGTTLQQNIDLVIAAYDSSSRILGTSVHWFYQDSFFGFELFKKNVEIDVPVNQLTRVRVYPKAM